MKKISNCNWYQNKGKGIKIAIIDSGISTEKLKITNFKNFKLLKYDKKENNFIEDLKTNSDVIGLRYLCHNIMRDIKHSLWQLGK